MEPEMKMYSDKGFHSPWVFITSLAASVLLLMIVGRRIIRRSTGEFKLPPGSKGWPFLGETIAFFKQTNSPQNPRMFIDEHESRYGPIFRCSLFGRPRTIVSVDPDFNKYVFQNEGRLFQSTPQASVSKLLGKYGLLNVHGELQRKLHGTAVNLLKYEKLSSEFMDDIQHVFLSAMENWEQHTDIRLQDFCKQTVLNLMGKKLMDLPPGDEMVRICKAFQDYVEAVLVLPINIPGTAYSKGLKARTFIINKINKCIKDRRQHPEVARNDLLTKLVREDLFTDEIIADFILFLLFAGLESSSRAMTFAVKFLSTNPPVLEELRAEHHGILQAKGKLNQNLSWDDYSSMKFTQCVIKETLRLASPAQFLFREVKKDVRVKGCAAKSCFIMLLQSALKHMHLLVSLISLNVIPKGWSVMLFLQGTNLDGKYHSDPLNFNPWRWQNEEELPDNPAFMPFGRGAWLCPGLHLAKFEIALFLHHFVTKFRWETLCSDTAPYFPAPSIAKGFPIRVYRECA